MTSAHSHDRNIKKTTLGCVWYALKARRNPISTCRSCFVWHKGICEGLQRKHLPVAFADLRIRIYRDFLQTSCMYEFLRQITSQAIQPFSNSQLEEWPSAGTSFSSFSAVLQGLDIWIPRNAPQPHYDQLILRSSLAGHGF